MREECFETGKYCGIKRHTKHLRASYPDLSLLKYNGYMKCGFCDTTYTWKIENKQIIYKIRKDHEYISEEDK
jgi:hypothetical protein